MKNKILNVVGSAVVLGLFVLALEVLRHELRNFHYHDIATAFKNIFSWRILLAAALMILANVIFLGYDTLAFRYPSF